MSEQEIRTSDPVAADVNRLCLEYAGMSPASRRAAMAQIEKMYCTDCGVPHGEQCLCWKGWVACDG